MVKLSIFSITSYECEVKKYQITFEITDWKTEKKRFFILYILHFIIHFIEMQTERRLKDCSSTTL